MHVLSFRALAMRCCSAATVGRSGRALHWHNITTNQTAHLRYRHGLDVTRQLWPVTDKGKSGSHSQHSAKDNQLLPEVGQPLHHIRSTSEALYFYSKQDVCVGLVTVQIQRNLLANASGCKEIPCSQ